MTTADADVTPTPPHLLVFCSESELQEYGEVIEVGGHVARESGRNKDGSHGDWLGGFEWQFDRYARDVGYDAAMITGAIESIDAVFVTMHKPGPEWCAVPGSAHLEPLTSTADTRRIEREILWGPPGPADADGRSYAIGHAVWRDGDEHFTGWLFTLRDASITPLDPSATDPDSPVGWEEVPLLSNPSGWELLPDNGFGAIIAAAAGSGRTARSPVILTDHRTRFTTVTGRRVQQWWLPRSIEDQEAIEDAANAYLVDAGLPARPSGFDWYLQGPSGWDPARSYADTVMTSIIASEAVHPAEVLAAAQRAITTLDNQVPEPRPEAIERATTTPA